MKYDISAKAEIFADNYMIDARIYHRCSMVYSNASSITLSNVWKSGIISKGYTRDIRTYVHLVEGLMILQSVTRRKSKAHTSLLSGIGGLAPQLQRMHLADAFRTPIGRIGDTSHTRSGFCLLYFNVVKCTPSATASYK